MIKISVIAPYEDFSSLFKETFEEHNECVYKFDYEQNEYELEIIVEYDHDKIKNLKLECDVAVARGFTAYLLRNMDYYIPVVEVPVAGNDLIRCLHESKMHFGSKKVIAIGSRNMIYEVESLSDIIGLEIKSHLMTMQTDKDIGQVFRSLSKEGDFVVLGGKKTCQFAGSLGMDNIIIKSGRAAIWQAITEAKRVAYISRVEQEKTLRFKTILDYAYEGVLAVDHKNRISVINSTCEKTLGISGQDSVGKNITDVLPKSRLRDMLSTETGILDEIVKHNSMQIAFNKVPIMLKGECLGTVVTFQDVTEIQEMEGKIREKIYNRGHIAKHNFNDIIGESKIIKDTIETAKRFSQVDSGILITGKTGTGKEILAQSIHNFSPRKKRPFVAVNCAALPENLLESELFGYAEGAFTGAAKGGKQGLFQLAHRGTIFLDEVSEISLKLQSRLLRVIQEKEIMRLGDDMIIPVDVRIISATNEELYKMVAEGRFREDLYYRLDVLKVNLPALDERKEDIPLIAEHFIESYGAYFKKRSIRITDYAKNMLKYFNWPGNIRELRNVCERLVVLNQTGTIDEDDVKAVLPYKDAALLFATGGGLNKGGELIKAGCSVKVEKHDMERCGSRFKYLDPEPTKVVLDYERKKIKDLLEQEGYNKSKVAKRMGIDRTTLWRRMKELGMS